MLFTEWNMEEALAEGMARGKAEGVAEGMAKGMKKGMAKGKEEGKAEERKKVIRAFDGMLSPEVIAEKLALPLAEVLEILEKAKR